MKVIEFPKKDKDELSEHAGKRLQEQLEKSGVLEHDAGNYLVLFDTADSMYVLANGEAGPADCLLVMERGKMAILAASYDEGLGE